MTDSKKKAQPLDSLRREIDSLDAKIQEMISERARLAFRVRESKSASQDAVDYFRPEREAQVLRLSLIHISEPTRPTRASRMPSSA